MVRDGLEVLREQLDLLTIMRLIEDTALWVDRETFEYLPVWYPEEARRDLMYKSNWSEVQKNTSKVSGETVHKRVGNGGANKALTMALGMKAKNRPNWTCCHIWGVDDPTYQKSNFVASDKRFYSCVGNMILLPTPLKAFTDVMQEVKDMLRIASSYYYDWLPDHPDLPTLSNIEAACNWDAYPDSWPSKVKLASPKGIVQFNDVIKKNADKRLLAVSKLLANPGTYFPTQEVLDVLNYWKIGLKHDQAIP